MENKKEVFDLTIIGGGPAGLFASFYAGLRELKVKIIEAQPYLGGKVHVYPEKMIWDVGGLTPISGLQFIDQIIEQGLTFDPFIELNQTFKKIDRKEDGIFMIETEEGTTHLTKSVIFTVGRGVFNPVKLSIENATVHEYSNLHYVVKSLTQFKNKIILISGGGNSAIDWANELAPIAKKIILVYRGDALKGHESEITKLNKNKIEVLLNTEITDLKIEDGIIEKVQLSNNKRNISTLVKVDNVIVNHGVQYNRDFMTNTPLDINLKDQFFIVGNSMGESNIPGIYAAGDALSYDGKLDLIAGAFQDAVHAVNSAKLYLEPEADEMAELSTKNDVFEKRNKEYLYK